MTSQQGEIRSTASSPSRARPRACVALGWALASSLCAVAPATAAEISGDWRMVDERTGAFQSIVRIEVRFGVAEARILRLAPEAVGQRCERCRGDLRNRPLKGLRIVHDLRPQGARWGGGKILDPESGKLYDCEARLAEDGAVLEIRGFVGIPAFGKTLRWQREHAL